MSKIFTYLIKERVDEDAVNRIYVRVDSFYSKLKNEARKKAKQLEMQKDIRVSLTPRPYKKEMRVIYSQQDRWPLRTVIKSYSV